MYAGQESAHHSRTVSRVPGSSRSTSEMSCSTLALPPMPLLCAETSAGREEGMSPVWQEMESMVGESKIGSTSQKGAERRGGAEGGGGGYHSSSRSMAMTFQSASPSSIMQSTPSTCRYAVM